MSANVFGIVPEEGTEAHRDENTPTEKVSAPESPQTTPASQDQESEQTADPQPAPPAAPQSDPAPEPAKPEGEDEDEEEGLSEDGQGFRIGNKVYKDILAADHAFRQNRGRAAAEAKRANALAEERDRLIRENAALEERLKTGSTTPQEDPTAPPQAPAVQESEAVDASPLTQEQINELIAEEGADAALLEVQRRADLRAQQALDARTAPLRQQEEVAEAQRIVMHSFEGLAAAEQDGNALFPELRDETMAPQIVATWDRLVTEDPDFRAIALSPAGAKAAYNAWQLERVSATSQPASAPEPEPPPGPTAAATRDAALTQMGQNAGTNVAPGQTPQRPAYSEDAVRKLIEAKRNPIFGVEVEARRS
jgi:hypothetical protein